MKNPLKPNDIARYETQWQHCISTKVIFGDLFFWENCHWCAIRGDLI